jgi:hypothetical protein
MVQVESETVQQQYTYSVDYRHHTPPTPSIQSANDIILLILPQVTNTIGIKLENIQRDGLRPDMTPIKHITKQFSFKYDTHNMIVYTKSKTNDTTQAWAPHPIIQYTFPIKATFLLTHNHIHTVTVCIHPKINKNIVFKHDNNVIYRCIARVHQH